MRKLFTFVCFLALLCSALPRASAVQQDNQASAQSADSTRLVIPEGTEIQLSLRDPLSSKLSEPGDEVLAVVKRDVVVEGKTLLKQGTEIVGRVTVAKPARRPLRGGALHITFDRVRLDGGEQKLTAVIKSASDFERDEKIKSDGEGTLKGGTSGGDVLRNVGTTGGIAGIGASIIILGGINRNDVNAGRVISGGTVAAAATILGASVVAGVLLTKGKEVRLDQGAIIRLKLERPLAVS